MNEIYTGKTGATLPPIQIHPPSMGSVLDMLNVINGILYVQIRYIITFYSYNTDLDTLPLWLTIHNR